MGGGKTTLVRVCDLPSREVASTRVRVAVPGHGLYVSTDTFRIIPE